MKYQDNIAAKVPLSTFEALLDNPENMKCWQSVLQSYDLVSGAVGSTMRMNYSQGKSRFSFTETVIKNNFPPEPSTNNKCKGVFIEVKNHLTENADDQTTWVSNNEFQIDVFMKVISWLLSQSMFRIQSCKYLND